ncbi:hypothetical protein COU59_01810 [Candidatus Pacearchaeota archaeon CG10_big_fil_rev_8_21_14_0_10_34_12]|nr:MAG: hypothetical protein COU59_01810 [Candidatus Pacearchaeota archaeon CG10_big_fil_rev_8_21_14_0_10_34_12]
MEKFPRKILIVIGTKAELIKCAPLMIELQKQKRNYWFVHTGQHSLKDACEKFGIKKPDFVLSSAPEISTKFWSKISKNSLLWSFQMIFKIRKVIRKVHPKYVIYHGDTMSTALSSIASSRLLNMGKRWKNVHLEAGLRSGSLIEPFPEEISRIICDKFSDILLAVSKRTERNLKKYSGKKVINVGNTIIDSAIMVYEKAKKEGKKHGKEYALINIHRHENLRNRERMKKIVKIINSIEIESFWPLHDNTKHFLKEYRLLEYIKKNPKITIMPLTDYPSFIFLIANCKYLVTDGGSIQEESLIFNKPCVILRNRTERQEGIETGINFLTKLNADYSARIINLIENNKLKIKKFKNPYGEEGVSKKIIEILK